ncbi:MAG: hypothetical protein NVS2B16_15860 [Chloroflexota bacterium]
MARLRLTTDIQASPEVCFDLVLDVDVQLSIDRRMQAVGGVRSGPLSLGDVVTWRARHFGIPWLMSSQIVAVERPRRFVDEMQRGPFARWKHVHHFEPLRGGTRMMDDVRYDAPLGFLGRAFDAVVLGRYMKRLLAGRNQRLKQLAESSVR